MKQKKALNETPNRFAFCHQNEALLYQFFLHECLVAFKKLHEEEPSKELILYMTGLEMEKVSPWPSSKGHLQKIHHYYNLMLTHFSDPTNALMKKLGSAVQKAIATAEECLQQIALQAEQQKNPLEEPGSKKLRDSSTVKDKETYSNGSLELGTKSRDRGLASVQQLKKEIKKIGTLLMEKLSDYQANEQVLFFFIRKHEQFDLLCGKPTVAKLLHSLFPGGLFEAGSFLVEKYSKKGFHHLIPTIEENISQLSKYVI